MAIKTVLEVYSSVVIRGLERGVSNELLDRVRLVAVPRMGPAIFVPFKIENKESKIWKEDVRDMASQKRFSLFMDRVPRNAYIEKRYIVHHNRHESRQLKLEGYLYGSEQGMFSTYKAIVEAYLTFKEGKDHLFDELVGRVFWDSYMKEVLQRYEGFKNIPKPASVDIRRSYMCALLHSYQQGRQETLRCLEDLVLIAFSLTQPELKGTTQEYLERYLLGNSRVEEGKKFFHVTYNGIINYCHLESLSSVTEKTVKVIEEEFSKMKF
ncbi:MAG: hypothetical protein FJZ63_05490 [Chlamydiae bacterium]|nr:hypothetical protein [Chlamydiota bacterium]